METIVQYCKRKLLEVGRPNWPAIAQETGLGTSFLNKLAYGHRENPTTATIQPLLTYFQEIDQGLREVPAAGAPKTESRATA